MGIRECKEGRIRLILGIGTALKGQSVGPLGLAINVSLADLIRGSFDYVENVMM